jgi:hypothetical protein
MSDVFGTTFASPPTPFLVYALMDKPPHLADEVEVFEEDGTLFGRDEHGEFEIDPPRGMDEPQDGRCNAVLTYTHKRYGETRYCGALPSKNFPGYDSDYCKRHHSREALMEQAIELVKHGAFGKNYVVFEKSLDTLEFVFAVEMFAGLLEQSRHDFETKQMARSIDASDTNLIDEDEMDIELPIPQNEALKFQANELWLASLDEIKQNRMQEAVFTDGVSERTLAANADMEGKITDTKYEATENHLHLPLSRLTKDIKEHLKNGGVSIDAEDESGVVTFQKNDYTLSVGPEDEVDESDAESLEANVSEAIAPEAN